MAKKVHPQLPVLAALVGLATGLAIGTAGGAPGDPAPPPAAPARAPAPPANPLQGVSRAEVARAVEQAQAYLAEGRPWAAWRTVGAHAQADDANPGLVLLGARAAAGWGGWGEVRSLLEGEPWLGEVDGGEGWLLLARAHDAGERWEKAAAAYRAYAPTAAGTARGTAYARMGIALHRGGHAAHAVTAFAAAAADLPDAADWMRVFQAEAMADAGDPGVLALASAPGGTAPVRARLARAAAERLLASGDTARALAWLENEARGIAGAGPGPLLAPILLQQAELYRRTGRAAEARDALARAAADGAAAGKDRLAAATRLGEMPGLTPVEQTARAEAFAAAGKPGLAARALRGALAAGAPDEPATRMRIGMLLFEESDFPAARAAFLDAAARETDPERAAEAELYAARSLVRAGKRDEGVKALRDVVAKRPNTAAAGTALFLLADETPSLDAAIDLYRRAAEVERSPKAQEAHFRLGDRATKNEDPALAARAWEEYAKRYPRGETSAQAAYAAGVIHERAGRAERARGLYQAAIAADPLSYYAVRAADRLGVDPLGAVLAEPEPWVGLAADPAEGMAAVRRLDVLTAAGMDGAWEEELAAQQRRLAARPVALLALAEGLRDRGRTVEAIRLGRKLLEMRGGRWDERLLRVVFPYAYRAALEAEAKRAGVEWWLLAGLVRQESSFDRGAKSWVGATGLGQIMPETGRWLAPSAGLSSFEPSLLTVPEINLRMAGRYLGDQMDRFGARDLALAAYNAGPSRAARWRGELGHGGDPDRFRERIPFDETRQYVKLVLRNAAVYRRLYGERRDPGLATAGE